MTLTEKLNALAQVGLGVAPCVTVADFEQPFGLHFFNEAGFKRTLFFLGTESVRQPAVRISPNVLLLNAQSVNHSGVYANVVKQLLSLTDPGREFSLRDMADDISPTPDGTAEHLLQFTLNDTVLEFTVSQHNDWLDLGALSAIRDTLNQQLAPNGWEILEVVGVDAQECPFVGIRTEMKEPFLELTGVRLQS